MGSFGWTLEHVVKGTTAGTQLLVLMLSDLCIILSSGLEGVLVYRNVVPAVCIGSGNLVGAVSAVFSCTYV